MSRPTVLRGVTVVDSRDGSLAPNIDVTLAHGRIVRIAPATSQHDGSVTAIDATGIYVVAGFLDMHAHPLGLKDPSDSLELMLANGITGFRQTAGSAKLLKQRPSPSAG